MDNKKTPVFPEIRVTNMTMAGYLPFKRKLRENEILKLMEKGFSMVNEEISPMIQLRIERGGMTARKTKKCVCISLRPSGSIHIFGVTSEKEGYDYYVKILEILKKEIKKVFE